jgi:quinone-modifying oxidoreductase subunit QmoC
VPVALEIATHRRFAECGQARYRRVGHLALFWGFVGAAVTSGLLIVAIYVQGESMPLGLGHPYKILGNVSAVLLLLGGGILVANRFTQEDRIGASTAFDWFFNGVVALVILTGVGAELGRLLRDLPLLEVRSPGLSHPGHGPRADGTGSPGDAILNRSRRT